MNRRSVHNTHMKKVLSSICAVLTLSMLICWLAACKSTTAEIDNSGSSKGVSMGEDGQGAEGEPLRVLVDIDFASNYVKTDASGAGERLFNNFELKDIGQVELECLPKEGEERAAALTRLRTEIMTGNGPDLLICACTNPHSDEQPLFRFPDQIMDQRLFLPLDDYMDSAKFTDFNKLLPIAMQAGRNDQGQQIVPLAFTLPMTVFRKSDVQHEHSKTMTWAEQLAGDDVMKLSAVVSDSASSYRSAGFKEIADYEDESLCFSEEELLNYLDEYNRLSYGQEELKVPDYFSTDLTVQFIDSLGTDVTHYNSDHHGGLRNTDVMTMVPVYSNQGGYIAYITSFAAINRNTQKPERAFAVLDYLLSPAGACSELYGIITDRSGMPVHMDVGTEENPIATQSSGRKWYLSQENYEEYCDLRDHVSAVRFSTPLERHIVKAVWDINSIEYKISQGESVNSIEKIVSDIYRTMKMELAES